MQTNAQETNGIAGPLSSFSACLFDVLVLNAGVDIDAYALHLHIAIDVEEGAVRGSLLGILEVFLPIPRSTVFPRRIVLHLSFQMPFDF